MKHEIPIKLQLTLSGLQTEKVIMVINYILTHQQIG